MRRHVIPTARTLRIGGIDLTISCHTSSARERIREIRLGRASVAAISSVHARFSVPIRQARHMVEIFNFPFEKKGLVCASYPLVLHALLSAQRVVIIC